MKITVEDGSSSVMITTDDNGYIHIDTSKECTLIQSVSLIKSACDVFGSGIENTSTESNKHIKLSTKRISRGTYGDEILKIVSEYPDMSRADIAYRLNCSLSWTTKKLKSLEYSGKIKSYESTTETGVLKYLYRINETKDIDTISKDIENINTSNGIIHNPINIGKHVDQQELRTYGIA